MYDEDSVMNLSNQIDMLVQYDEFRMPRDNEF
jgi:hypothetical protein